MSAIHVVMEIHEILCPDLLVWNLLVNHTIKELAKKISDVLHHHSECFILERTT